MNMSAGTISIGGGRGFGLGVRNTLTSCNDYCMMKHMNFKISLAKTLAKVVQLTHITKLNRLAQNYTIALVNETQNKNS